MTLYIYEDIDLLPDVKPRFKNKIFKQIGKKFEKIKIPLPLFIYGKAF
jgi:hypothetical protein